MTLDWQTTKTKNKNEEQNIYGYGIRKTLKNFLQNEQKRRYWAILFNLDRLGNQKMYQNLINIFWAWPLEPLWLFQSKSK